eukprot:m.66537 g.66537  ORF g.66537 m.66537 type:complete len:378 (+) comp11556_c0_seq5:156-1289(+)
MMDNDGHNVPTLRVSSPPQSLHNAYQQPPWMKSKRNGLAASRRADKMKNRRERSARNRSASCPVTMKKPLGTIVECDEEEEEEGKKFELEEQMKKEKEVQDFLKKKGKRHNGHLFESYNQTNICAIDGIRPRSWSVGSPISNQCNPMLSAKRTSHPRKTSPLRASTCASNSGSQTHLASSSMSSRTSSSHSLSNSTIPVNIPVVRMATSPPPPRMSKAVMRATEYARRLLNGVQSEGESCEGAIEKKGKEKGDDAEEMEEDQQKSVDTYYRGSQQQYQREKKKVNSDCKGNFNMMRNVIDDSDDDDCHSSNDTLNGDDADDDEVNDNDGLELKLRSPPKSIQNHVKLKELLARNSPKNGFIPIKSKLQHPNNNVSSV